MNSTPQQLTKEAVWKVVREMNDCWTMGSPDDLANYFHHEMVALTPEDRERLKGREMCLGGWKRFAESSTIHSWKEIDPLVQVYEQSAVVTYYYSMDVTIDERRMTLEGRDMLFLIQEEERWWVVADQFSSYPEH